MKSVDQDRGFYSSRLASRRRELLQRLWSDPLSLCILVALQGFGILPKLFGAIGGASGLGWVCIGIYLLLSPLGIWLCYSRWKVEDRIVTNVVETRERIRSERNGGPREYLVPRAILADLGTYVAYVVAFVVETAEGIFEIWYEGGGVWVNGVRVTQQWIGDAWWSAEAKLQFNLGQSAAMIVHRSGGLHLYVDDALIYEIGGSAESREPKSPPDLKGAGDQIRVIGEYQRRC